jgi:AraC-like DNA-binding protein
MSTVAFKSSLRLPSIRRPAGQPPRDAALSIFSQDQDPAATGLDRENSAEGFGPRPDHNRIGLGNPLPLKRKRRDHRVERSIDFMMANLNRPLNIAMLAAEANISASHLFAVFKRKTGHAPMDYFTKLRMGEACRLLDLTSASVKEVAAMLGYDDPFYFSRVFKSLSAWAPRHYRRLGLSSRQEIRNRLEPRRRPRKGGHAGSERIPLDRVSAGHAAVSIRQ